MILDELIRLQRFRRIAVNHGFTLPEESMLPYQEVEYLQGLINAKFFLEAEPWMCPSWVVLSRKEINTKEEFVTEFHNTLYRNWSNIGGVGSKRYGIVDSRGLVTSRLDYGSIDFWLLEDEELHYPALIGKDGPQLKLVSSEDQLYEWKTQIKSVEFARIVYHVTKDNHEYIHNEIILRNLGLEKITFTFYAVIRPMSPLGVELIETTEYDTSRQSLFVNGNLALMSNKKPTAIMMGDGGDANLPDKIIAMSTQQDTESNSETGFITIVQRFDVTLPPAGSESIVFGSPLFAAKKTDDIRAFSPSDNDRDKSVGQWFDFADARVEAIFPDERITLAFNQATASLVVQAFPVMFPEESHLASLSWKERMRVLIALVRSGCSSVTEKLVSEILSKSAIHEGSLDLSIFSPMLWGLLQYYEHVTDAPIPGAYLQHFKKHTSGIVLAIQNQMGTAEISIEAESIIEDEQPLQHYLIVNEGVLINFEDQLWNLAALETAHRFFTEIRDEEMIDRIAETLEKYRKFVFEKSNEIKTARWLRSTDPAMLQIEREILDVLASVALLQLSEIDPKFLEMLCSKIAKRRIVNNLWKYFPPNERYSSHLALRLAHYYTMTKQRALIEPLLERVLDFLSDDYLLPEFVNPRTYGGSAGSGSSVLATTDLILLLRDMLLYEDGSNLIVLAGVPAEWFTSKKALIIDALPSRSGKSHIELGTSSNQHQIEITLEELPEEIEVHVSSSVPMSMVKAYGASIVERQSKATSPFLRLIPLSPETVLTYHK